ncbi:MAG TPA: hypothetical protein VHF06_24645, partial [Pseudonocardiaceae bacterium]|nr:hypothetical protein [Pseudonocardiaceae bacterium]
MKHLVDLDEEALAAAQEHLGTATIKNTVNAAPNLAVARSAVKKSKRRSTYWPPSNCRTKTGKPCGAAH